MALPEVLRWLLTVTITVSTAFHLHPALRPSLTQNHRITEFLHVVMGAAMVAMLWPFGRLIPASTWLVLFTGSAGWFAVRASLIPEQRIVTVHFASTAAAMAWMGNATPPMPMPDSHIHPGQTSTVAAAYTAAVIGGYLIVAGLCWVLNGLRLGTLRPTAPAPEAATTPRWHWPTLNRGIMAISMGMTALAMI